MEPMSTVDVQEVPDGFRDPRRPRALRRLTAWKVLVGTGLVVYCWFAAEAAPFTTKSLLTVLVPGAVLGAIAYGHPPERIPPPERLDILGFSYWILALGLLFEWEASSVRASSHWYHPSLTDLVNPIIHPHPLRSAAMLIWLLVGWGLVKR
jgi:hypothetical protein